MNTPSSWFDISIPYILEHEGGDKLVNNPKDPGGITRWGVSFRFLRAKGLDVNGDGDVNADDIRALSLEDARGIYALYFWNKLYEQFPTVTVAAKVFDTAVNTGPVQAHRLVQESLTTLGQPLKADGFIGPRTVAALKATNPSFFLDTFKRRQASFYLALIAKNAELTTFRNGWLRRAAWPTKDIA